jgi:hypothetical protein
MKRTMFALTLVLALLFSAGSAARSMHVVFAQFEGLPYDPPIISVSSPAPDEKCSGQNVPFNVTVQIRGNIYHNTETIRCLNYSLDGQTPTSMAYFVPSDLTPPYYVTANDVLDGLSDGTHELTTYVVTAIGGLTGNFNKTISFEVDTSQAIEPFPTTLVVAAFVVIVAIASVGLTVYFKKRNRQAENGLVKKH